MTATELVNKKFPGNDGIFVLRNIEEFMIEFAKLKVTESLKAACCNAEVEIIDYDELSNNSIYGVNSKSILNSYDLNDIK